MARSRCSLISASACACSGRCLSVAGCRVDRFDFAIYPPVDSTPSTRHRGHASSMPAVDKRVLIGPPPLGAPVILGKRAVGPISGAGLTSGRGTVSAGGVRSPRLQQECNGMELRRRLADRIPSVYSTDAGMAADSTEPMESRKTRSASLSSGVGDRLMMTSPQARERPWGRPAAG